MMYAGNVLFELKHEDWDGKAKEMLVWENYFLYPVKETVIGYSVLNNKWVVDRNDHYEHYQYCAEIPKEKTNVEMSRDTIVEMTKRILLENRIDTAIRLIQNDQAITAMGVLKGEDDELLDIDPLKDYPKESLDEKGYRKFFNNTGYEESTNRVATNRELAQWLAEGKGEQAYSNHITGEVTHSRLYTSWKYSTVNADESCDTNLENCIMIRKWSDTEWHLPTIDYMGI